jgi:hypothetical protein
MMDCMALFPSPILFSGHAHLLDLVFPTAVNKREAFWDVMLFT